MDNRYVLILIPFSIFMFALFFSPGIDSSIPPTPAFSRIVFNGEEYDAQTYDDILILNYTGEITTAEQAINRNTFDIKLKQMQCPLLQAVIGVDNKGDLICGIP